MSNRDFYERKKMSIVDDGHLFRHVIEEEDEGMIAHSYEEWDDENKRWKRISTVRFSERWASAIARQIAEVGEFVRKQEGYLNG